MTLRSDWQSQKRLLEKAKVDVKLFKDDLGPRLDAFETAEKKVDAAKGTYLKGDPQMIKLRADLKTACDKLAPTAVEYEHNLKYLVDHATDSAQKPPLKSASNFMFEVADKIRLARRT